MNEFISAADCTLSEIWESSGQLRWKRSEDSVGMLMEAMGQKPLILQQLWHNQFGKTEWRDVPIE